VPATIRVGYSQPSGAMLPLWVITEARLDQKYGFHLQNIYISGAIKVVNEDADVSKRALAKYLATTARSTRR
jgi:hypothetical protein